MELIVGLMIFVIAVTVLAGLFAKKILVKKGSDRSLRVALKANMALMASLMLVASVMLFSNVSFASEGEQAATEAGNAVVAEDNSGDGMAYLAAALSTGLATIGAGIAVAVAGSAALGAISEDSKLLGKTLIFVGLAEGIAIYGLIISIMILNKV